MCSYCPNDRKPETAHKRSKESIAKQNRRKKKQYQMRKGKLQGTLRLAEKDHIIERLQDEKRRAQEKSIVFKKQSTLLGRLPQAPLFSSAATQAPGGKQDYATSIRVGRKTGGSLDALFGSLQGIPIFSDEGVTVTDQQVGKGLFGVVKVATLRKLGIKVAAKVLDISSISAKAIKAEAVVGLSLSGHQNFPYCFGLLGENIILMEYFQFDCNTACPTLASKCRQLKPAELKSAFESIFVAFSYMHSKNLLHNDIKADNIILADTVKIIDFGKVTTVASPAVYKICPGTKEHEMYNQWHRHLAHELRNIPGSKQSVLTDTYSLGYMLKHTAGVIGYNALIQLGRLMKKLQPSERISIDNALNKLSML